jgi:hypothetical protein
VSSSMHHTELAMPWDLPRGERAAWLTRIRERPIDSAALTLALAMVPISIAVSESFLALAVVARVVGCVRHREHTRAPRVFWFWAAWAGLEVLSWLLSPELRRGWSEIRHLLLIGALIFVLPALKDVPSRLTAWRGIFLSSAVGSLFLLGDFAARLIYYRREIGTGDDVSLYLRTGGLLNNWMVFGTVEILVVAGLLSFWFAFPEERRRWWPVAALNAFAVLLSLTRTVWVSCLLLVGLELFWKRSRWLWLLPLLPIGIYGVAPHVIRSRVLVSMRPDYYSNAERLQMFRVGWQMIREKPITGVGPGRVDKLYRNYLSSRDPVPAYHGHLHNNLFQLTAQFGIPVALTAILFTMVLCRDLWKALKAAATRESQFFCHTALLALTGFLVAGCFDYTYGHSLALILLAFSVIPALIPGSGAPPAVRQEALSSAGTREEAKS